MTQGPSERNENSKKWVNQIFCVRFDEEVVVMEK
jgi:hypothetical protein